MGERFVGRCWGGVGWGGGIWKAKSREYPVTKGGVGVRKMISVEHDQEDSLPVENSPFAFVPRRGTDTQSTQDLKAQSKPPGNTIESLLIDAILSDRPLSLVWQCQSLPVLHRALSSKPVKEVDPRLVEALEHFYEHRQPYMINEAHASVYLGIVNHIFSYKGAISKQSILWPHNLLPLLLEDHDKNEQAVPVDLLVPLLWRFFPAQRSFLVRKLIVKHPELLPEHGGWEAVILSNVPTTLFTVDKGLLETLLYSKSLTHRQRIKAVEGVDSEDVPDWMEQVMSLWADQRLLMVGSISSQEALACALASLMRSLKGTLSEQLILKYGPVMAGVTLRVNSVDHRQRVLGMAIGEMFALLVGTDSKLSFDLNPNEEMVAVLRLAFDGMAPDSLALSSDEENLGEHEELALRRKYIERGERVPHNDEGLVAPSTVDQAMEWIRAGNNRVKFTLGVHHLLPLLKASSELFVQENAVRVFDAVLVTPNTFQVAEFEDCMQGTVNHLFSCDWAQGTETAKRALAAMFSHAHKLYYGDSEMRPTRYRTISIGMTQRMAIFSRIANLLKAQECRQPTAYLETPTEVQVDRFPALRSLEQSFRRNRREARAQPARTPHATQLLIRTCMAESFAIPFYRQATREFEAYFRGQNHAAATQRVLLLGAVIINECARCSPELLGSLSMPLLDFATLFAKAPEGMHERPIEKATCFLLKHVYTMWPLTGLSPLLLAPHLDIHKGWLARMYGSQRHAPEDLEAQDLLLKCAKRIHSLTSSEGLLKWEQEQTVNELAALRVVRIEKG